MRKCPNCNETISPDQYFCSGACRKEWNDAQRTTQEDAKTPYEKIKDENFGCLVMSIVATIFFSLPVVAIIIDRSEPLDWRLYFYGGMFALFASITFIWIRKMIRDAEEERLKQAEISAEAAKNRRPILGTDYTAEEKKNLRLPPSW